VYLRWRVWKEAALTHLRFVPSVFVGPPQGGRA
jgi:hypothetical protein